jgi:hypothetical protein
VGDKGEGVRARSNNGGVNLRGYEPRILFHATGLFVIIIIISIHSELNWHRSAGAES